MAGHQISKIRANYRTRVADEHAGHVGGWCGWLVWVAGEIRSRLTRLTRDDNNLNICTSPQEAKAAPNSSKRIMQLPKMLLPDEQKHSACHSRQTTAYNEITSWARSNTPWANSSRHIIFIQFRPSWWQIGVSRRQFPQHWTPWAHCKICPVLKASWKSIRRFSFSGCSEAIWGSDLSSLPQASSSLVEDVVNYKTACECIFISPTQETCKSYAKPKSGGPFLQPACFSALLSRVSILSGMADLSLGRLESRAGMQSKSENEKTQSTKNDSNERKDFHKIRRVVWCHGNIPCDECNEYGCE